MVKIDLSLWICHLLIEDGIRLYSTIQIWTMTKSDGKWLTVAKDGKQWSKIIHFGSWFDIHDRWFLIPTSRYQCLLFVWSLSMKVRTTVSHHCHCHLENFGWCPSLVPRQGWGFVLNMRSLMVLLSLVCLEVAMTFFLQKNLISLQSWLNLWWKLLPTPQTFLKCFQTESGARDWLWWNRKGSILWTHSRSHAKGWGLVWYSRTTMH